MAVSSMGGGATHFVNIPQYDYESLYWNSTGRSKNADGISDTYIKDRMEVDYTVRHPNAQFESFNRYLKNYPEDSLSTLIPYVFFVRPDLNILNNTLDDFANDAIRGDATFRWLFSNAPEVLRSLSTNFSQYHDYVPYLGNKIESMPTFDFSLKVNENTQAFTGYRSFYAGNAIESTTGINFDISFKEDNNLSTLKMFYAWTYYIDGVVRARFTAKDEYRYNRIADYYTSIYYILCGPDGQKILYFQKITGAFPTNTPLSLLSMNIPMTPESKVSISFSAFSVEQMNPIILSEFNYNSRMNRTGDWSRPATPRDMDPVPHYESDIMTGRSFVGTPYIYGDSRQYYLMWNRI